MDKTHKGCLYVFLAAVVSLYLCFWVGYECNNTNWYYWPTIILSACMSFVGIIGSIGTACDHSDKKNRGRR